ncbi:MAG TPA: M48 family metalloprotease [Burkholderiales bacterium]|nr:M48 family metalloprotease [Burkholderiales bacterium]
MKRFLASVLLIAPALVGAQPLLDFRDDLAFSAVEIDALAAQEYAARLSALARSGRLDRDPVAEARLRRILARLQRAAAYERPSAARFTWEIHTCSGCDETASAMAGGKLLVSTDFIAGNALSDDELAYLLAHEMAHVLAEHTREFSTIARFFLGNGLNRGYDDIHQELAENLPVILRMGPDNVQQELEADYIGLVLGARAGFAPEAMLSLLDKLQTGEHPLFGTHPGDTQRAQHARAMLETGRRLAARSRADR